MKPAIALGLLAAAALAGCGQKASDTSVSAPAMDAAVAPSVGGERAEAAPGGAGSAAVEPSAIPVSLPKIAYVYEYGFRIAAGEIPSLQRRHADLCEKQGPDLCRILEMRQSGEEGDYASGSLALAVAAPRARSFGAELARAAGEAGGSQVSSAITGEDLSKQIVDTEARLRARTLLRDRLMEVLATRKGTVAELVEAERGVAQVNEEIDQARSWLAEMKGRVDFSRVNISYTSGAPTAGGFLAPIRAMVGSLGSILGTLVAMLIGLAAVLTPLAILGYGLRRGWLWLQGRRKPATETESEKA